MEDINKALEGMMSEDEQVAMEQAAFASVLSFAAAERRAEIGRVLDDPWSPDAERDAAVAEIEAGIEARARVLVPRLTTIFELAANAAAEEVADEVVPEPKVIRDSKRRAFAPNTFYSRMAAKDALTDFDKRYMLLIEEREEAKVLRDSGAISFDEWNARWDRIHEFTSPMARALQAEARAKLAAERS